MAADSRAAQEAQAVFARYADGIFIRLILPSPIFTQTIAESQSFAFGDADFHTRLPRIALLFLAFHHTSLQRERA